MAVRAPRSIEAATRLLEQYAELDGQIATIEEDRQSSISAINARCDTAANDLIARRDDLAAVLGPWWSANSAELTCGKRKSIELGGCVIGSKTGRASLYVGGGEDDVVAAKLAKRPWTAELVRVAPKLDKAAVLKALDGEHKAKLKGMGFSRTPGAETFFVQRAEQAGTRAAST
jgi:phage host-nuclease inhibitor protein Gam